jgi:hypothetical protein
MTRRTFLGGMWAFAPPFALATKPMTDAQAHAEATRRGLYGVRKSRRPGERFWTYAVGVMTPLGVVTWTESTSWNAAFLLLDQPNRPPLGE